MLASPRLRYWFETIARYASVQLLVQAIGFAVGLMTIRTLSKEQYAFFTIANTMQGTITVLADIGISNAVQLVAGRVWEDRAEFGSLIRSALRIRRILAGVSYCVVGPITMVTLMRNGMSAVNASWLTLVVLSGTFFITENSLLVEVPRMRGEIQQLQKFELGIALFRLIATALGLLLFHNVLAPIIAAVLTSIWGWWITRRVAYRSVEKEAAPNPEYEKTIWRLICQQAPDTLYYTVQGPVTLALISWFGRTSTIADLGALGRFAVILTLFNTVVRNILLPRFAKEQNRDGVRKIYFQILSLHILLGAVLIVTSLFGAKPILWMLGSKYAGLENILIYVVLQNVVGLISGIIYHLNANRGWTKTAWLSVPLAILAQIITLYLVDISTVVGVVIFTSVPSAVLAIVFLREAFASFAPRNESGIGQYH